jgi:hypothetical protein
MSKETEAELFLEAVAKTQAAHELHKELVHRSREAEAIRKGETKVNARSGQYRQKMENIKHLREEHLKAIADKWLQ